MIIKSIIGAACACLAVASFNSSAATVLPIEWEVMALINQERTAVGLNTLAMDSRLFEAARFHSEEMFFNDMLQHDSFDGTNMFERIQSFGYPSSGLGEIIAAGYSTASAVVDAWAASPAHLEIMLNSSYKGIGVGWAQNYWTVDFGSATVEPVVPIPNAVWLFGSGLLGLVGVARRKKS